MGLEVKRAELVQTEGDFRLTLLWHDLAVGDRVEVLDAGLLRGVVRVAGGRPGLYALKRHALPSEQDPQALMADVVDHLLGAGSRPAWPGSRSRTQAVLGRLGLGDLLDLAPLGQRERPGPPAHVLRVERLEAIGVEVVEHGGANVL
ncbi:hypothetical protein [Microbispora sp. H10830]|uniref:hypothetical protein n=1 Tax=Microbispora sp. H10830 TaxID=2729109 RepID=UPI001601B9A6|nr:hypothetical protein [Microbispora sp. H10830]